MVNYGGVKAPYALDRYFGKSIVGKTHLNTTGGTLIEGSDKEKGGGWRKGAKFQVGSSGGKTPKRPF